MSNRKKDLIDFLIEYLVVSNYSNSFKIDTNSLKPKFKSGGYFNSKIMDIKLEKYSNIISMEKEYLKYHE